MDFFRYCSCWRWCSNEWKKKNMKKIFSTYNCNWHLRSLLFASVLKRWKINFSFQSEINQIGMQRDIRDHISFDFQYVPFSSSFTEIYLASKWWIEIVLVLNGKWKKWKSKANGKTMLMGLIPGYSCPITMFAVCNFWFDDAMNWLWYLNSASLD